MTKNILRLLPAALGVAAVGSAHAAVFTNGSFEIGTDPGSFTQLSAGSGNITGWTIDSGTIDYVGSYWQASDGNRSVDLSGTSMGSISQTFDTEAGHTYRVLFDMAGNPDGTPATKTMTVSASVGSQDYDFDITGNSKSVMGWSENFFEFTATGAASTLAFASTTNSSFGPALDNVRIIDLGGNENPGNPVPEPASLAALGLGAIGLIRRKAKRA